MAKIVKKQVFNGATAEICKYLLGKYLVRRFPDGWVLAKKITEVECYDGLHDGGSHASRGQTRRNSPMFGSPGHWYVYFTYGMHYMLNIVTREKGYPAAILIRGLEGVPGPARLTKLFKIDKDFNAMPADRTCGLWVEDRGVTVPPENIRKGPRVGISYAGPYWARRHLRFWIDD